MLIKGYHTQEGAASQTLLFSNFKDKVLFWISNHTLSHAIFIRYAVYHCIALVTIHVIYIFHKYHVEG